MAYMYSLTVCDSLRYMQQAAKGLSGCVSFCARGAIIGIKRHRVIAVCVCVHLTNRIHRRTRRAREIPYLGWYPASVCVSLAVH